MSRHCIILCGFPSFLLHPLLAVLLTLRRERVGDVLRLGHDNMGDSVATLDFSVSDEHGCVTKNRTQAFIHLGANHEVGHSCFILDGHEQNAFRRRRTLAHQHDPRDREHLACGRSRGVAQMPAWDRSPRSLRALKLWTNARQWMTFERDRSRLEVHGNRRKLCHARKIRFRVVKRVVERVVERKLMRGRAQNLVRNFTARVGRCVV